MDDEGEGARGEGAGARGERARRWRRRRLRLRRRHRVADRLDGEVEKSDEVESDDGKRIFIARRCQEKTATEKKKKWIS